MFVFYIWKGMKKVIVILCMFFYIASSLSLSVRLNYCNEQFSGLSLLGADKPRCCCDDEPQRPCCDSGIIQIEKTDEHQRVYTQDVNNSCDIADLSFFFPSVQPDIFSLRPIVILASLLRPPPLIQSQLSLFILHRVFRI